MTFIRPYRSDDAPHLSNLYVRSVRTLAGGDYSERQIDAWAKLAPDPARLDALALDGRLRLVAEDSRGAPAAFADLEPDGHIHYFYCAPEAAGTGTAGALYDALETAARERGLRRLYAEASEGARRFFLKRSFTVLARRAFEISGVAIHNYAVEKTLAP
ncbi:MAG: GNAT family N-acetyltransferase [Amphiplicatus sp.]